MEGRSSTATSIAKFYLNRLVNGQITFSDVPLEILASEEFIDGALELPGNGFIDYLNSQSPQWVEAFIDACVPYPEAMAGKLYALGLRQDLIPEDVRQFPPFIKVSMHYSVSKLVGLLNSMPTQSARLALKWLSINDARWLVGKGLSILCLPHEIFAISFSSRDTLDNRVAIGHREVQQVGGHG
jgi:hypothetical protein